MQKNKFIKLNQLTKNDLLIISATGVVLIVMIGLTFFYLGSRQGHVKKVASSRVQQSTQVSTSKSSSMSEFSSTSSSSESTSLTSSESLSESTITEASTSASDATESTVNNSSEYVSSSSIVPTNESSSYRYLYTAAGGDTLYTIYELTGVSVDQLAAVNQLDPNVVLVKGQTVYVP